MWKLPYNLFIKNRLPETTSLLPVITFIPSTSYTFFLMLCVFCSHIPLFSTLYTLYTGKTLAPVYVQYQYIRLLHDRLRDRKALPHPKEILLHRLLRSGIQAHMLHDLAKVLVILLIPDLIQIRQILKPAGIPKECRFFDDDPHRREQFPGFFSFPPTMIPPPSSFSSPQRHLKNTDFPHPLYPVTP